MRLTVIFLSLSLVQVSAKGLAQKVTYSNKHASLEQIFKEIRKQSGVNILISSDLLEDNYRQTVDFRDTPLNQVLDQVLQGLPLTYEMDGRNVLIKKKERSFLDKVTAVISSVDVRGRVVDSAGNPLSGATVIVKGKDKETMTGEDGAFILTGIQPDDILIISHVGMEVQEVPVNRRKNITVSMQTKIASLQEFSVNTGFQQITREETTGAAVTVSSTSLEKRYTPNIIDNLEGRVPGLVNARGTTTIRGVSTINANKSVLIVVDGLPIEGSISDVNPYDIESVSVLKDAAATAIYGARATNGVIVITTKRARSKRTSVEFSSNLTIADKPDIDYQLLAPARQVDVESDAYKWLFSNTGPYGSTAAAITATTTALNQGKSMTPIYYAYYQLAQGQVTQSRLDDELNALKQNNFRKQFKDHALLNDFLQQYNFAVRTDGVKFQSSLVLNYKRDNSGIIDAFNRQLNIFYKGTYQPSTWMDVNFGVNSVLGKIRASNSNFATSGTDVPAYYQLLDNKGNHAYYTTVDYNAYNNKPGTTPAQSMLVNHLDELALDSKYTTSQNTRYYVNLDLKVLPGLTIHPQFQYEHDVTGTSAYSEPNSYIVRFLDNLYGSLLPATGGKLVSTNATGDYWTARGQANYSRVFGPHAIDVIAGAEYRQTRTIGNSALYLGYDDQLQSQATTTVSYPALRNYTSVASGFKQGQTLGYYYSTYLANPVLIYPETIHRFNSGYANATYTYDRRYNIFGSYRIDYADAFGLNSNLRGAPFWSTGVGWNIHNEAFMSRYSWVNFLKLRATYGITGNMVQGVTSLLTARSSFFNTDTNVPESVVINAANPNLKWEKTGTANLGLDFTVLSSRLIGSFDVYRKRSTELLVTTRIDPSEGFTSQIINNGSLTNIGLELSLQYKWIRPARKDGFSWSTTLVLSRNSNKITYVDEVAATPLALAQGGYKVGYPVNALFSYQYKGINSNGQPQWLTGDGKLSSITLTGSDLKAMVYSGGSDPKLVQALTNEVHYKGFSLYVLAVYYGGNYLRALVPNVNGLAYASLPAYVANAWTPANKNTLVPGFGQYAPGTYPGTQGVPPYQLDYSNSFVRPGDFIKIRSAVLGYQLPEKWVAKMGARNLRLDFQLNNPKAIWTKNRVDVDPETGGASLPASYVMGINVNF